MNYPPEDIEPTREPEEDKTPADAPEDAIEERSIHYGEIENLSGTQSSEPAQQEEIPEFDFSAMESQARANIEELGFAPLPEFERPAPRRRRQRQPILARISEEEMPDRLENLARRAVPTFDFFVFALVAGAVMGIGFILNSPAILLLAVALAPFPGPWLGVSLGAASGESRFFGQTLGGFFTASVFVTGWLAGLASRIFMPLVLDQAYLHARLWGPDLLLVVLGTIALLLFFIAKEDKPALAGLLVNYELLLPISAAGFGLGNNTPGLWPQALGVFLVHLALSLVLALAIFYYMGFRPMEAIGYAWGAGIILVSLMVVVGFAGIGAFPRAAVPAPATSTATPTETLPVPTASITSIPAATATASPVPPTATLQPTNTTRPSATPVVIPTIAYGRVQFGATIRTSPGGTGITTIMDGYVVEILPDEPVTIDGNTWIRIKVTTASRVIEGWVLQNLVVTPTPPP